LIRLTHNPTKRDEFCNQGLISASGTSSDLSQLFKEVGKLVKSFDGGLNG